MGRLVYMQEQRESVNAQANRTPLIRNVQSIFEMKAVSVAYARVPGIRKS